MGKTAILMALAKKVKETRQSKTQRKKSTDFIYVGKYTQPSILSRPLGSIPQGELSLLTLTLVDLLKLLLYKGVPLLDRLGQIFHWFR